MELEAFVRKVTHQRRDFFMKEQMKNNTDEGGGVGAARFDLQLDKKMIFFFFFLL